MSSWWSSKSEKASNTPAEPPADVSSTRTFLAGSSFRHVDTVVDTETDEKVASSDKNSGTEYNNTWMPVDAAEFSLRVGPNYKKTGLKAPSAPALYELVGVDCIQSALRVDDIGSKLQFPAEWEDAVSNHPDVPPVFVVNAQIPSNFDTSLFSFTEITDGDGWSLVQYFRIRPEVAAELADLDTASPAVKLLAGYCKNAPTEQTDSSSTWFGRFKLILRCENIEAFGLPGFITSYNGKPVLLRNTGNIQNKGGKYAEMDINVHRFSSVPKKGLSVMMDRFDRMDISIAFCIEGREDDEMPEVVLGCTRIHRPDYTKAPHWGELALHPTA